jgi:amino acid transporter
MPSVKPSVQSASLRSEIGCIIGAGIFVLTGTAAARYAGPAIMLSFVIGGIACAFVELCYAELAALLPVAGSTYTGVVMSGWRPLIKGYFVTFVASARLDYLLIVRRSSST